MSDAFQSQPLQETEAIQLSDILLDDKQTWRVHNCKLIKQECDNQGTLPFLYHYDSLPDALKQEHPLKGRLLPYFNQQMTAQQACETIGVPADTLVNPIFIKITGSVVVFLESLQLAVRLHWSNTSKQQDSFYCQTTEEAVSQALEKWLFIGRVDTLYKGGKYTIMVADEQANTEQDTTYQLPLSSGYQQMPAQFAISLIEQLHHNPSYQQQLSWIDSAIRQRVG